MKLIQILLPLYDKEQNIFPNSFYTEIKKTLTEKYGGITAYTRSPATGLWKEETEKTVKDEIIIHEIMAEELDKDWWTSYKKKLEETFQQEEIIIRSWEIELL